jgi:hypothetical protein
MMSSAPLDITELNDMLEIWHRELFSHCVGVTKGFGA